MTVYVGTSGWQYRHWRGLFYPRRARGLDDLAFFAERFQTVELNGTFYKLPEGDVFEDWRSRVPNDFVFAVKASRFLTHIKRLREPEEPVERLMERAKRLGPMLGPVLLQLPPQMRRDTERLEQTLAAFGKTRVAVEFRHDSWFTDETRVLLERHNAALCLADRDGKLVTPEWRTADWGYIRFHAGTGSPPGCYEQSGLRKRAGLLNRLWPRGDIYVYFNNDGHGCALKDAAVFADILRRRRMRPTRAPEPIELRQGA